MYLVASARGDRPHAHAATAAARTNAAAAARTHAAAARTHATPRPDPAARGRRQAGTSQASPQETTP